MRARHGSFRQHTSRGSLSHRSTKYALRLQDGVSHTARKAFCFRERILERVRAGTGSAGLQGSV